MSLDKELEELFGNLSDLSDGEAPRPVDPGPGSGSKPGDHRPVPKVGTRVQRGDTDNRRKAAILIAPIPPRPPRSRRKSAPAPRNPPTRRAPTTSGALSSRPPDEEPPATTPVTHQPAPAAPEPRPTTSAGHAALPRTPPICAAVTQAATSPATRGRATARKPPAPGPARGPPTTKKPVPILLPTGERILVPHSAVYRNRKFRARTGNARWLLRFDPQGRLRTCRRMKTDTPP